MIVLVPWVSCNWGRAARSWSICRWSPMVCGSVTFALAVGSEACNWAEPLQVAVSEEAVWGWWSLPMLQDMAGLLDEQGLWREYGDALKIVKRLGENFVRIESRMQGLRLSEGGYRDYLATGVCSKKCIRGQGGSQIGACLLCKGEIKVRKGSNG